MSLTKERIRLGRPITHVADSVGSEKIDAVGLRIVKIAALNQDEVATRRRQA